jgi:F-type H+-transporting ATPase subunit b
MENLGIDWKLLVAQIANFIVFYFIFSKFLAKPFMGFLAKQKQAEKDREMLTEGLAKREEELKAEKEAVLKDARAEMNKILAEAKVDGQMVLDAATKKAKDQADDMLAKAKEEISRLKAEAGKDMQKQAVDTALILLSKGITASLNEETKKSVTKYIIDNSKVHSA